MQLPLLPTAVILGIFSTLDVTAADRVVLPIEQRLTVGAVLYSIKVGVEGTPVDLLLDTGSTGLRVLHSSLPATTTFAGGQHTKEGYDNGVRLDGLETAAHVSFGSLTQSTPIELIESAACDPAYPTCVVAKKGPSAAWGGLQGIVGISLEAPGTKTPVSNSLNGLAASWIVTLPEPGSKSPGELILDPNADDLKGFVDYPAFTGGSAGAGRDNPIPGCIKKDGNGKSFCGPIVLDTGKPVVTVITDQFKDTRVWSGGSSVDLSFGSGESAIDARYVVKPATFPTRVLLGPFPKLKQAPTRVLAGIEPFLLFDVLYDGANATIGLRRRSG
jgi:hypothetical protein